MIIEWTRRGRGSYVTSIDGNRYALVNMKGDGPNAPRWQGPVPAWEVRLGGDGEADIGSRTLATVWTLEEAKAWVARHIDLREPA